MRHSKSYILQQLLNRSLRSENVEPTIILMHQEYDHWCPKLPGKESNIYRKSCKAKQKIYLACRSCVAKCDW